MRPRAVSALVVASWTSMEGAECASGNETRAFAIFRGPGSAGQGPPEVGSRGAGAGASAGVGRMHRAGCSAVTGVGRSGGGLDVEGAMLLLPAAGLCSGDADADADADAGSGGLFVQADEAASIEISKASDSGRARDMTPALLPGAAHKSKQHHAGARGGEPSYGVPPTALLGSCHARATNNKPTTSRGRHVGFQK